MDRRSFLKHLGLGAASMNTLLANPLFAESFQSTLTKSSGDDSKVFVFIQLRGGNDGLNTVIPIDQYDALSQLRPHVILKKNELIPIGSGLALHPALREMADLFQSGFVSIAQGVGHPNHNMSHFKAEEILWGGASNGQYFGTGWLGRSLEKQHPNFPVGHPNSNQPDPFCIAFDDHTLNIGQGSKFNFAAMCENPKRVPVDEQSSISQYNESNYFTEELNFIQDSLKFGDLYQHRTSEIFQEIELDDSGFLLGEHLNHVITLLKNGSKTKFFLLSLSGFDTHSDQVDPSNHSLGKHADRLTELSKSLAAFERNLKKHNLQDRVMGLVNSEFGRRILSNASNGTDHGQGMPWFLFGHNCGGKIIGANPQIPLQGSQRAQVEVTLDYRKLTGSIFEEWFQIPHTEMEVLFEYEYEYEPLSSVTPILSKSPSKEVSTFNLSFQILLQDSHIQVRTKQASSLRFRIYNSSGRVLYSKKFARAIDFSVDLSLLRLNSGRYFYDALFDASSSKGSFVWKQ